MNFLLGSCHTCLKHSIITCNIVTVIVIYIFCYRYQLVHQGKVLKKQKISVAKNGQNMSMKLYFFVMRYVTLHW